MMTTAGHLTVKVLVQVGDREPRPAGELRVAIRDAISDHAATFAPLRSVVAMAARRFDVEPETLFTPPKVGHPTPADDARRSAIVALDLLAYDRAIIADQLGITVETVRNAATSTGRVRRVGQEIAIRHGYTREAI